MRRLLGFTTLIIVTLIALAIVGLVAFRVAAAMREAGRPIEAAGAGARYQIVSGLRIHYREWGPADGKSLLLVPGTMAWSGTWNDIAEPLGKLGYRVVALDLPPFGFSDRPSNADYSRAATAKLILGFANTVGLNRFALGVHSYGGGAAIEAAFAAPERINALILLDVALGLGKPYTKPPLLKPLEWQPLRNLVISATFTNPLMIGKGLRDFIHDDVIVTDARTAIYKQQLVVSGTTSAVGDWLLSGLYNDESGSLAADIANYRSFREPALVIWGGQDTVTPLDQGEEIAAAFPQGRLEILDNVNHIPHVEKPEAVVQLISDFLRTPSSSTEKSDLSGKLRGAVEGR